MYPPATAAYQPPAAPTPTKRRGVNKPLTIIALVVLVIAVVAAGIGAWTANREKALTQAEFLNLINQQLPGDSIPAPDFIANIAMTDIMKCTAYDDLDPSLLISGAVSQDALGGAGMYILNFRENTDATAAANATQGCDTEAGYNPQLSTGANGDVHTWTLAEVDPEDSSAHTVNIAVVYNIMVYAYDSDPAQWQSFVTGTFESAAQAARKAA